MKISDFKTSIMENYPQHQDLSGVATEKLKAYLARQGQQSVPGEGGQVRRVQAELQRRKLTGDPAPQHYRDELAKAAAEYRKKQGVAEGSNDNEGSADKGAWREAWLKQRAYERAARLKQQSNKKKPPTPVNKNKEQGVAEGYTGRETKDGTWRVFKDGLSVSVAGPFKSKEEASTWIKKQKQGVAEGVDPASYPARAQEAHEKYLKYENMVDQELRKLGQRLPQSWDAARMSQKLSSHPKYALALKYYDLSEKFASLSIRYEELAKKRGMAEGSPKVGRDFDQTDLPPSHPQSPENVWKKDKFKRQSPLVKDRKTGKLYDPTKEFDKKMNSPEVMAQMKRMAQKEGVAEGSEDTVKFEVDSENAYNHVMKQFGSVVEWDGDTMVAPRKYWGSIQELAYSAGGEANEVGNEQGMTEAVEDRTSYQVAKALSDHGIKYDPARESDLINAIGMVLVKELNMTPREARAVMNDEDFLGDTMGELRHMESGVTEDAVADFLARGGQIQKGKLHKPRKGETWQGSSHIGAAGGRGTKGTVSGRAANTNPKGGKPVVSAEGYNPEYDDEAGMAENNLETLRRAVDGIDDVINSGDNLPEWCQEKIAVAKSMLVSVWDYMRSEEEIADPEIQEMYEAMDQLAQEMSAKHGVDVDTVWEGFESMDDHVLYETAAWRRKEGKSKSGGLNAKGVASYRRENPGSKLQTAVTTKPSKLKKGSKAAKRRKSFCARMGGVKGPMKKPNGKPTRKALALRKWNC
jgi:hypothetical protein